MASGAAAIKAITAWGRGQMVGRYWRIGALVTATGLVAASGSAWATAGLLLTGVGAKEKGMGGAGMALTQDAVAPINNPAATVHVGDQFTLGGTVLFSEPSFEVNGAGAGPFPLEPGKSDAGERQFVVPFMSVTHRINDRWSAAFSNYGLFGLGVAYPSHPRTNCPPGLPGTGPLCDGDSTVDTAALFISPTIAYRVTPTISVGFSPALVYSQIKIRGLGALATFGASADPAHVSNNGTDHAFGYAAKFGVHYQGERLSLGLTYQTEANMQRYKKYRGLLPEGGNVDLPAIAAAGLAYDVTDDFIFVADVQYIFYSDVPALANGFVNPLAPGNPLLGTDRAAGFGWNDQYVIHVGAQHQFNQALALRAGYSYASELYPGSESLLNAIAPAVLRHTVTGGFSLALTEAVTLDAAMSWAFPFTHHGRNALSPDQTISSVHEITEVGLGLSYAW